MLRSIIAVWTLALALVTVAGPATVTHAAWGSRRIRRLMPGVCTGETGGERRVGGNPRGEIPTAAVIAAESPYRSERRYLAAISLSCSWW